MPYDGLYCLSDIRDGSHGRKVRLLYTYQAPVYVISLLIKVFIKLTLKLIFVYWSAVVEYSIRRILTFSIYNIFKRKCTIDRKNDCK